ncbi:DUF6481 family protein [Sphingomonas solaris]|uniref:Uncharacterized protein n=1 Tax=Alterirhizorhabdus solaris TaxID=2529389 RepID=A0A558R3U4_9SPHN|nr:DUF6481 family protein [Sphingomonas solaris]TVV74050.1 hypothetical protein FOY91_10865 [Sphingomonas solaris]
MAGFKDPSFNDRAAAAAKAKQAALEKFKAKPVLDEATLAARRVAEEAKAAREAERRAARTAAKEAAEQEKLAAIAAKEAAAREAEEAKAREESDNIARQIELLAEQKAARDAKYAARKARK